MKPSKNQHQRDLKAVRHIFKLHGGIVSYAQVALQAGEGLWKAYQEVKLEFEQNQIKPPVDDK